MLELAPLALTDYRVHFLSPENADILQRFYECCQDYAHLEQGQPYSASAASEEFDTVPEGKTAEDKFIIGLFEKTGELAGMIECIRGYPDTQSWWLGLMLLAPQQRGRGVGAAFYGAVENWVLAQGARQVHLAALEENAVGRRFWEKMGFAETRRTTPRPIGLKTHTLIVYCKTISTLNVI